MNEIKRKYYSITYLDTPSCEVKHISSYLDKNIQNILEFFMLDSLDNIKIILYSNYNDFCNEYYKGEEIKTWVYGFVKDNIIHMLDLNTTINSTSHKNATLDYLSSTILHEMVHAIHNTVEKKYTGYKRKGYIYFREAIACILGNPKYHKVIPMDISLSSLLSGNIKNYDYYYTLGKYMIDNIPHDKLLEYVRDCSKLDNDIEEIFNNIKKGDL